MKTIAVEKTVHKRKNVICLKFSFDKELIQITRLLPNACWSYTLNAWHIDSSEENEQKINVAFEGKAHLQILTGSKDSLHNTLTEESSIKLEKFKRWMLSMRYSSNTINTYYDALKIFLRFYHTKPIGEITNDDIITFNNDYILANHYSASFQNQVINAIKLFFKRIENSTLDINIIHRPKRAHTLPNVLSKEEVKAILVATKNNKHNAMLSLIYSCGLRCGEVLHLKPEHIDGNRKLLIIREAKGNKDRIVPLSTKILSLLRSYYASYKPKVYLFEGAKQGEQYTNTSLQQVIKRSTQLAGINKPVTLHWLRHSYATHLLENGTNLRYIQEILGHKSSKTTEIYTHVSNHSIQQIQSPFDTL